jgi:photosystem II stability/assembly factor-like uncharacterized protein
MGGSLRRLVLLAVLVGAVAAPVDARSGLQSGHRAVLPLVPRGAPLGAAALQVSAGPQPTTRELIGVAAPSASVAWAAGMDADIRSGVILETGDGGASWVRQLTVPDGVPQSVAAVSPTTAWVVGLNGILKTGDGGSTWVNQTGAAGGARGPLTAVAAVSPSVAWVVGGAGTILKTTDGGATWMAQESGSGAFLVGVAAASEAVAWAVGGGCFSGNAPAVCDGVVLGTRDGGATWTTQLGPGPQIDGVAALSAMTAVAVGQNRVYQTMDGGSTWRVLASGLAASLSGVSVQPPSTIVAVGFDNRPGAVGTVGVVLATTDGGASWAKQLVPEVDRPRGVALSSPSAGWAVGARCTTGSCQGVIASVTLAG